MQQDSERIFLPVIAAGKNQSAIKRIAEKSDVARDEGGITPSLLKAFPKKIRAL